MARDRLAAAAFGRKSHVQAGIFGMAASPCMTSHPCLGSTRWYVVTGAVKDRHQHRSWTGSQSVRLPAPGKCGMGPDGSMFQSAPGGRERVRSDGSPCIEREPAGCSQMLVPRRHLDERGWFCETFHEERLQELEIS
jgi:hypothetical protein